MGYVFTHFATVHRLESETLVLLGLMAYRMAMAKHLLSVEGLSKDDAYAILRRAEHYLAALRAREPASNELAGRTVVNAFFEASTRTRSSFEIAAKRLGAEVVNLNPSTSSVTKGETIHDTVTTLDAMNIDGLVVRHVASGAADYIAKRVRCSVINAGDGLHEHPTQALLDAFTILNAKKRLSGLTVAICGDILHSRVARSDAILLKTLGATVRFAAPATLLPARADEVFGVEVYDRLEPALRGADVVMALRIQKERLDGALLPSFRDYAKLFVINKKNLELAAPDAIVMHPGPMNRSVEISSEVADSAQSRVLSQVESGVAVRCAVLARTLLATSEASPADIS